MTVTNQSMSLLDSVLSAKSARTEAGVAVFKLAKDAAVQQGEAMVKLLETSAPEPNTGRLDVYA